MFHESLFLDNLYDCLNSNPSQSKQEQEKGKLSQKRPSKKVSFAVDFVDPRYEDVDDSDEDQGEKKEVKVD